MGVLQAVLLWDLPADRWLQASLLGRSSGVLSGWRSGSWLLQALEPICFGVASLYLVMASQPATGPLGLILLAMAGLLGVLWITRGISITAVHLPLGVFWGIATLATLLSPVTYAAVDGWIKLTLYLLGALFLHQILQRSLSRSLLVGVLLLVGLWMSIYGLRQHFYGAAELATWVDPESGLRGTTRIYSYLLNPNLYGGFLIPLLPLGIAAMFYWRSWGWKLLALVATILNLGCLLLTYSRGAWIGGAAALAAIGLLLVQWLQVYLPQRWRAWALPTVSLLGGAVAVLGVISIDTLRLRVLSIFAGRNDTSNNFRINVWMSVLDMIRDFSLLGIGPGNDAFNRVYPLYQRGNYSALGAYSVPLELTVETGLIGVIAFCWFLGVLAGQGWRHWSRALRSRDREGLWVAAGIAAGIGLMTHGLVDTVWYRPQIQMLWWLSVALITTGGVSAEAEADLSSWDGATSHSGSSPQDD